MPLMDLTYPAGALDDNGRATVAEQLTAVILRAERAPDTEFFRSITWLNIHELPTGHVRAAGRPVEQPTFKLEATLPAGALSDRRKQELVSEATRVLRDAAGIPESEALRVWVLIREVPDGNWGAAGNVIHFEQLRQLAAGERHEVAEPAPAPTG